MFRPVQRQLDACIILFIILLGVALLPATATRVAAAPDLGGTLPLDVTVSDLISSPGQSQLYTLNVAGADHLVIRLLVISGDLDPALALRDPGGNLLCDGASLGSFVELNCPVAGAGSYTVVVTDGQDDGTGNFNLYAQAVQQPAGAVALALDTTATTALSPDGEMDAFTLTGSSGQTLLIRLLATSGDLDPAFRLFRPDGTELCSGSTLGSFVDTLCFLDTSGPFVLFVADGNGAGTGNYNLYAQNLQTPANAVTLTLDETESAQLSPDGEADSFQFSGQSGERLLVRLLATSGDLDPAFRLFRPDGTQLCSGSTLGSFVETLCSLDTTGQYHLIVADGNGAGSGSYNLYLQALIDPANSLPLNLDVPEAALLSPDGEADAYRFDGQSGDWLLFRLLATSGDLDPQLRVYRPDGTQLCSGSTLGSFVEIHCLVDSTGGHTVIVADGNGAGTGSYNLYLQNLLAPANAAQLLADQSSNGMISPDGEADTYTMAAGAGERVMFRLLATSGDLDPQLRVYRPDGTQLCSGSTLGSFVEIFCLVEGTGPHTVVVTDGNGGGSGSYNLYQQNLLAPAGAVVSGYGKSETGAITPDGEADAYTMRGMSGDLVALALTATSGNLDPQLRVYRPDGTELCGGSTLGSSVAFDCTLDTSGTHLLIVDDGNGAGTGSYSLNLTCLFCPQSVDLTVAGSTIPAQPRPNQPFQYEFVVTNAGPLVATQVVLTDTLAANLAVTAISSSQGSCSQTDPQHIQCNLGSLAPAGDITIVLTVVAAHVGNYENAVQVTADQVDSDCSDNVAQLLTTVSDTFTVYLPIVQRP